MMNILRYLLCFSLLFLLFACNNKSREASVSFQAIIKDVEPQPLLAQAIRIDEG